MLDNFVFSKKFIFNNFFMLVPVLVLFAFSISRGLGNTLLYLSLIYFFIVSSFLLKLFVDYKYEFKVYGCWIFVLIVVFYLNGSNDYKTLIVYSLTSLYGLILPILAYDRLAYFRLWASRLVFALFFYELVILVAFYINDGSNPASNVNLWNLVVLSPLLFLNKMRLSVAISISAILFLMVFFAASRTEMLGILLAAIVYFSFIYRKFFLVFLVTPLILFFTVAINQFFRSKIIFDDITSFLSRVTSHRSDIWIDALSNNQSIWIGNGLGSSSDLSMSHGAASMHNIILELYWDFGLVIAGVFVALVLWFLKGSVKVYLSEKSDLRKLYAVFAASLSICVCMMMLDKSFFNIVPRFYFYYVISFMYILSFNQFSSRLKDDGLKCVVK